MKEYSNNINKTRKEIKNPLELHEICLATTSLSYAVVDGHRDRENDNDLKDYMSRK